MRRTGNLFYKNSGFHFEPNPEPDEFAHKLTKLLDALESDKEGVRALVEKGSAIIQVISIFHNGNTMLGGLNLNRETVMRLANLNLEVDFDFYAEGNFFLDDFFWQ